MSTLPKTLSVDFQYSPSWWQTLMCLPFHADKVLVGKEGQILMDFGKGKQDSRLFELVVEPGCAEGEDAVEQVLEDPAVPRLRTRQRWGGIVADWTSFVFPDPDAPPVAARIGGEQKVAGFDPVKVQRVNLNWRPVPAGWNPAWGSVAFSDQGEPIEYDIRVPAGAGRTVVLGFWPREGVSGEFPRMDLNVEGADPQTLANPADESGPCFHHFAARDLNGDGLLRVRVSAHPSTPSAVLFLNAVWVFDGEALPEDRLLEPSGALAASCFVNCGVPHLSPCRLGLGLRLSNPSSTGHIRRPVFRLRYAETKQFVYGGDTQIHLGAFTRLCLPSAPEALRHPAAGQMDVVMPPVALAPGETVFLPFRLDRHPAGASPSPTEAEFSAQESATLAYWTAHSFAKRIHIPDPGIQALMVSSLRNIDQAKDWRDGRPAFHVGPTFYRQLWIVDGAFLLECATRMGLWAEARAGIDYMLGFQLADGSFQLRARYWKEAGIVLWAVIRHARLTRDPAYLRQHWPALLRAAEFLRDLRNTETAADPASPDYRLFPWGVIDGGITNDEPDRRRPEYSNVQWALVGLRTLADAAAWLGETEQAVIWREEFEDLRRCYRKAARRDLRRDGHGNLYLPVVMGNAGEELPQRAQWTFCHALYPGEIFDETDRDMVEGQLAMLRATRRESCVFGTGWMKDGIWTYFNAFLAQAHLVRGEVGDAIDTLYAFANHAAPNLTWREEQKPLGEGDGEVGDMPHNWASAEFVRLVLNLFLLDQDGELHLCRGLPRAWLQPGARISLQGITTPFGDLDFHLQVSTDGRVADLELQGILPDHCRNIRLWEPFPHSSLPAARDIPVTESLRLQFSL